MNFRRKRMVVVCAAGFFVACAVMWMVVLNESEQNGVNPEHGMVESYSASLHDFVPKMLEGFTSATFTLMPTNGIPRALVGGLQPKRVTSAAGRVIVTYDGLAEIADMTNALPVSVKVSFGLACADGKIVAKDVAVDRVHVYTVDRARTVVECDRDGALAVLVESRILPQEVPVRCGDVKYSVDNKIIIENEVR